MRRVYCLLGLLGLLGLLVWKFGRRYPLGGCSSGAELVGGRDHLVDVGKLTSEHPGRLDVLAVPDQEGGAHGYVEHPQRLERDVEATDRVTVPVGQERDVHPERLRPRAVRPRRVTRDREGANAGRSQIVAPVPQEVKLVRSGR